MNNKIFGYGKKKWLSLATVILAIVLPATVVASVIITYQINGSVYAATSPVIFTPGPNYGVANKLGFSTTTLNSHSTEITISLGGVQGSYGTYLLDQIQVEQASGYKITNTWTVSFNVSGSNIPSGVFIYMIAAYNATATTPPSLTNTIIADSPSWAVFLPSLTLVSGNNLPGTTTPSSLINVMILNITGNSLITTLSSGVSLPTNYKLVNNLEFETLAPPTTGSAPSTVLYISFIVVIPTSVTLTKTTFSVMMTVEA
ncbi:MAG: hypothetical protein ACP5MW_05040 [Thermoplasmata archaeon]